MLLRYWKNRNKNKVFSNYIYLLLIQGANFVLPLIALPYLVITLEPQKYGLVMIAQSISVVFTIIVDFGFNISATREVAILRENKKKMSKFYWNIYAIKIILIFFTFLLLYSLTLFIGKLNAQPQVFIYSFGLVIGQAIFPTWFFQGIEKMKVITLINIIAKVFFTISIFFFVLTPDDFEYVPILNGLGYIFAGLIGFIYSLKYVSFIKPEFSRMVTILKESFSLFISNLAVNIYSYSNTIILGFISGDSIAGVYASMEKLVVATKSIYIPLYQSIFPYLSNKSFDNIKKTVNKIKLPIILSGTIISLILITWSKSILDIIYGDDLIVSYYKVFQILGGIAFLSAFNMLYVTLFFPTIKAYKIRMRILIFAGVLHLILVLTLTRFNGIYGVAISAVITEFIILIIGRYYFNKIKA